jgi:hypothetical protein
MNMSPGLDDDASSCQKVHEQTVSVPLGTSLLDYRKPENPLMRMHHSANFVFPGDAAFEVTKVTQREFDAAL